jgi:hypothetical protein
MERLVLLLVLILIAAFTFADLPPGEYWVAPSEYALCPE